MADTDSIFVPTISGTFYRAIDPSFREFAIAGSRSAGRYSREHEPTLYLSSSIDGVEAAMIAHKEARSKAREIVELDVEAAGVVDLRDSNALEALGIDLADALAPWQDIAAAGGTPASWMVRDRLLELGANGVIDPSRKRLGLWHLVLFRWNEADAPIVRLAV
ncbi:RES family NAD+ phosphorylase [Agreia pratensis]|uniref:RES domain-containing protein n=1 Tax=Agreia pratensis TaxID=150121 RepID=A0A1X7IJ31_9MICO|nr:RES domain-containing protein [Agreia pratensis]SMG14306.1 RES domain-containing protein [Agreia pratensis]